MTEKKTSFADNVEILTKEVIEEAEAEVGEILRDVEKKSQIMIQETKIKLESEVKEMFDEVELKIRKERESRVSEVQSQKKSEILNAKEEIINSILSRIEEKLIEFTKTSEYKLFLKQIFKKMLNYLESKDTYLISLNKEDMKYFTNFTIDELNQNSNLNFAIAQMEHIQDHGILIVSQDRKIILEDTLEKRFNQKLEKIRKKIAEIFFKE